MTVQTIIAGAGAQDVEVYATDALGRVVKPTSATAAIVDLDFAEGDPARIVLASGAATVDALATTTTAETGQRTTDARRLPMTSAAGFVVGRFYVIGSAGKLEAFEVDRISGLNVYARDELRATFATGATVTGCRVSVQFPAITANDAAQLEQRHLFGADWIFAGVTGPLYRRSLCRIERRAKAPRCTIADVIQIDPRLSSASHDSSRLESHVLQADDEITARLMHRGSQVANTDEGLVGRQAVAYRALELAYRTLGDEFETRADWAMSEAREWLKLMLGGHKPDDVVEVTRTTDSRRGTRRAGSLGVVPS